MKNPVAENDTFFNKKEILLQSRKRQSKICDISMPYPSSSMLQASFLPSEKKSMLWSSPYITLLSSILENVKVRHRKLV